MNGEVPVDAIDDALARLEGLEELDVAEHVVRFEAAHAVLTEALQDTDKV